MMIKNMSIMSVILLLMHFASPAIGQSFVFRVLANKGDNKLRRSSGDLQKLKTGTFLNKGDQLITSTDAYIGLVHKSGKTLEIRKKGTLGVEELEKQVDAKTTSVTGRYMEYVMSRLGDNGVSDNFRKNSNVVGAAVRGNEANGIELLLPVIEEKRITSYEENIILRWIPQEGMDSLLEGKTFVVTGTNLMGDTLLTQEVTDYSISFDLSELDEDFDMLLVNVVTKEEDGGKLNSVLYSISPAGMEALADEVTDELTNLKTELDLSRGVDRLMLAAFYEQNGMILEAIRQYELVMQEHPEVSDYREFYQEFLSKNQMLNLPEDN
ncbi:MAG: hypothetical protein AAFO69_15410 [Bacteroidota bacterium]